MVSEKGDIPEREDVEPPSEDKEHLLQKLLERGETMVELRDGSEYELHGYDTYLFFGDGIVYTQDEDNDEVWFFTDEITSLTQH